MTRPRPPRHQGFTLIEVMVALMVVAMGLAALMITVGSTARTSGYLRDKTLAQWIALNRIAEVRLNLSKFGQNTDTGEVYFANRTWHYDTRYFDTTIASLKRIVVRVYAGDAKTKGNPIDEATGFLGSSFTAPGSVNVDWTVGSTIATAGGTATPGTQITPGTPATPRSLGIPGTPVTVTPTPPATYP